MRVGVEAAADLVEAGRATALGDAAPARVDGMLVGFGTRDGSDVVG